MLAALRSGGALHTLDRVTLLGRKTQFSLVLDAPGVADRHALLMPEPSGWRLIALAPGVRVGGRPTPFAPLADGDEIEVGGSRVTFFRDALAAWAGSEAILASRFEETRAALAAVPGAAAFLRGASGRWRVLAGTLAPTDPGLAGRLDRWSEDEGIHDVGPLMAGTSAVLRYLVSVPLECGFHVLALMPDEDGAESVAARVAWPLQYMAHRLREDGRALAAADHSSSVSWVRAVDRPCESVRSHKVYWVMPGDLALVGRRDSAAIGVLFRDHEGLVWTAPLDEKLSFDSSRNSSARLADTDSRIQGFHEGVVTFDGAALSVTIHDVTAPPVVKCGGSASCMVGLTAPPEQVDAERARFAALTEPRDVAEALTAAVLERHDLRSLAVVSFAGDPRTSPAVEVHRARGTHAAPPTAAVTTDGQLVGAILAARLSYFTQGFVHDHGRAVATSHLSPHFAVPLGMRDGHLFVLTGSPYPGMLSEGFVEAVTPLLALAAAAGARIAML